VGDSCRDVREVAEAEVGLGSSKRGDSSDQCNQIAQFSSRERLVPTLLLGRYA